MTPISASDSIEMRSLMLDGPSGAKPRTESFGKLPRSNREDNIFNRINYVYTLTRLEGCNDHKIKLIDLENDERRQQTWQFETPHEHVTRFFLFLL